MFLLFTTCNNVIIAYKILFTIENNKKLNESAYCTKRKERICVFWENYEALCKKAGKSPSLVAREAGLSSGAIFNWKNRQSIPRNAVLVRLADVLGVSVSELIEGEKKESKSVEEYAEIASIMKAFEGLTESQRKEVLHYLEYIKTKRE